MRNLWALSVLVFVVLGMSSAVTTAEPNKPASASAPASEPATTPCEAVKEDLEKSRGWVEYCTGFQKQIEEKYGTRVGVLALYTGQVTLGKPPFAKDSQAKGVFFYQLDVQQNLWKNGQLNVTAEGGSGQGLDRYLGTILGTNGNAGEPDWIFVKNLYLQQSLADEKVILVGGKLDLTDFFDQNAVANCAKKQFLSPCLVNNPTIPFPEPGIGAAAKATLCDLLYLQAGVADADAVASQMGTNTAFHGQSNAFSIGELGLTPKIAERQGNYRFMYWYDTQPVFGFDGNTRRDNSGFALSFDQEVTDKLTLFVRYGNAPESLNLISNFWSTGAAYTGLIPGRDKDVFAVAVGQGITSPDIHHRAADFCSSRETILETYYRIQVNDLIQITPDLQVLTTPFEAPGTDVIVVAGIRLVFSF